MSSVYLPGHLLALLLGQQAGGPEDPSKEVREFLERVWHPLLSGKHLQWCGMSLPPVAASACSGTVCRSNHVQEDCSTLNPKPYKRAPWRPWPPMGQRTPRSYL